MRLETTFLKERGVRLHPDFTVVPQNTLSTSLAVDYGTLPEGRSIVRPWNGGMEQQSQRIDPMSMTAMDHQAILITSVWMTDRTQCCPAEVKVSSAGYRLWMPCQCVVLRCLSLLRVSATILSKMSPWGSFSEIPASICHSNVRTRIARRVCWIILCRSFTMTVSSISWYARSLVGTCVACCFSLTRRLP